MGLPWILYQWKKAGTFCELLIVIEYAPINCLDLNDNKRNR